MSTHIVQSAYKKYMYKEMHDFVPIFFKKNMWEDPQIPPPFLLVFIV